MITIKRVKLTKDVLKEIRRIDTEFYPNISFDWYLSRYKPYHSAFVAESDGKIVGYVGAFPVRKELYDAVLNGVLVDDLCINPAMYLEESAYYYAGSFAIQKAYQKQGIGIQLVGALLEAYQDKKICVLTVTKEGYTLAERFFLHAQHVSENVDVFVSK